MLLLEQTQAAGRDSTPQEVLVDGGREAKRRTSRPRDELACLLEPLLLLLSATVTLVVVMQWLLPVIRMHGNAQ